MPYSPMQLAEAFIQTGELSDAVEALNTQIEANPTDDAARRLRSAVRLRLDGQHDLQLALADLDALTEVGADDHVQRSIIQQRLGDWKQAHGSMESARSLRPSDEWVAERYALTLEHTQGVAAARAFVATQPQTWRWLQLAGDLARAMGDVIAADAHYAAALVHLESKMNTETDALGINLKSVLVLKRESLKQA